MPEQHQSSTPTGYHISNSTFLCFDFGLVKTGVAVGQSLTRTASPVATISYPKDQVDYAGIGKLLAEWKPDAVIVGLPLTENGEEQLMTRKARNFAKQLEQRFACLVHFAEERYSSRAAQDRFKQLRQAGCVKRSSAGREDAVAAQIILENWLQHGSA